MLVGGKFFLSQLIFIRPISGLRKAQFQGAKENVLPLRIFCMAVIIDVFVVARKLDNFLFITKQGLHDQRCVGRPCVIMHGWTHVFERAYVRAITFMHACTNDGWTTRCLWWGEEGLKMDTEGLSWGVNDPEWVKKEYNKDYPPAVDRMRLVFYIWCH